MNQTEKLSFLSIEMYRVYRHRFITLSIDRKRWPFENDLLGAFAFEARKAIGKASFLQSQFSIFEAFLIIFLPSEFMN